MIRYKYLSTADKDIIQGFTLLGDRQNCDYSFSNLISWRFLYNTEFAIVYDCLVFRFYNGRHLTYLSPLPRPGVKGSMECAIKVVNTIREDSIAMGHPFVMTGVNGTFAELIKEGFPEGTFVFKPNRDYMDYIYTREKLANLTGKHLQSKRNHINKFKSLHPDYEYRELIPDMIPLCLTLEQRWRERRDEGTPSDSRVAELRMMTRAFRRWGKLDTIGGTIWVGEKLVAFTFGCPINHETFDVCVEKADSDYQGAFTIINQEFVKHLPEQYVYINREEDMGNEGLRKAKLSYKPDILLEKSVVMEKRPLADFEDQGRILRETRDLWKTVFNDSEEFIDMYFERVYSGERNVTCQINHHVVAALQALPYTMLYHGREVSTAYISGMSTHPNYRKQGIGSALMRQANFNIYCHGGVFAELIPAGEWLFDWYGKRGYVEGMACEPAPAGILDMSFTEFDAWQRQRECAIIHDPDGLEIIKEDIRISGKDKDYKPATTQVRGMVRVVNAEKALQLYAWRHHEVTLNIRVQADRDIPMNNAYYVIANGTCERTEEPQADAKVLFIDQLATFIFDGDSPEMCMMLE